MDRFLLIRNSKVNGQSDDADFFSRLFEGYSADDISLTCLLLASKFDEIDDNLSLIHI